MSARVRRKRRAAAREPQAATQQQRSTRRKKRSSRLALGLAATATAGLIAGTAMGLGLGDPNPLSGFVSGIELGSPGAWLRREPFLLKRIIFRGLDTLEIGNLVELTELRPGLPLIDIDSDKLERQLETHPRIVSALALRLPPSRLIVRIEERQPIARLGENGEGIDHTGARFRLEPGEAQKLVAITGESPPQDLIAWALPALEAARRADFELVSARALGPGDVELQPREPALRVRVGEDASRALREFEALIEDGILDRVPAGAADFRFPGQVVLKEIGTH